MEQLFDLRTLQSLEYLEKTTARVREFFSDSRDDFTMSVPGDEARAPDTAGDEQDLSGFAWAEGDA